MDAPRVSEHDREYFRRIGEFKAESHRDAIARHQRRSPNERLIISADMTRRFCHHPLWNRADDAPEKFYERARALGLYGSRS